MIYLFGDSWGFSYKQVEPQVDYKDSQIFFGADLASLIMQQLDKPVTNLCERGMNLYSIMAKITKCAFLFKKGDLIIVLQTDPLRSYFVPWYTNLMIPDQHIVLRHPSTMLDICNIHLLTPFYTKLKILAQSLDIQIMLHGGISAINQSLADTIGLCHTDKSSTEVICSNFKDSYFFDAKYVIANNNYFKDRYDLYVPNEEVDTIVDNTLNKNSLWNSRPDCFTHNHTTELGTTLVASYLSKEIQNARL